MMLNALKASILTFLFWGIICALALPIISYIVLKYWENVSKGADDTELAIVAHEKTIENYNQIINNHKEVNIPPKYRNPRAMSYIRDHMKSQEAQTIDQAISQYENLLRQEKSIALQEEQIRLQKQQIAQANQIQRGKTTTYRGKNVVVIKQHGHSIIIHLLLCSVGIGFITIPYYTLSKHHYWHL